MENIVFDVLILGGGPSGLTAAIYCSRAGLKCLVIAGNPSGGQLMWTTEVENYPGFPNGIVGSDLISAFRQQAQKFDAKIIDDNVTKISGSSSDLFTVETYSNKFVGKTVIVATGASAKWLELPSEQKLRGKGVSACAICDGFFFKNKVIAVVGGGDAAMEEALYLTKFASKVFVLVRGDKEQLRASKIMQEKAFSNAKIDFLFNTEVKEVLGKDCVTGVCIVNNKTGVESDLELQGLFIAIGHEPNTEFLEGFVELGKFGYVTVGSGTKTSKEGVFAAGDAADYRYRQAVTAAGFGCMAAIDTQKYLVEKSS